jgi:hypothetical protein
MVRFALLFNYKCMLVESYNIPKNLTESFDVLDEIFSTSKDDQDWINTSKEEEVVTRLHSGLGREIRNAWGFWTKDTELYTVLKNMGLWHADDMYSVVMTSYYRKLHGTELDLKGQIQQHINYWKDYEKINGPVEKE